MHDPEIDTETSDRSTAAKSPDGSTSQSLIHRLQNNEAPAWQNLVHLYSPLIFYWCQRAGLPAQECPDVVQDVFRSVVPAIGKYRKRNDQDTFRGWLRTITRNKVHDHFRRAGKEPSAAGGTDAHLRLADEPDIDDELGSDEDELRVQHELYLRALEMIRGEFKPQTWQAFWRVVVDGQETSVVAEELEMRPGTVRVAKSRVLKRLRENLGELLQ